MLIRARDARWSPRTLEGTRDGPSSNATTVVLRAVVAGQHDLRLQKTGRSEDRPLAGPCTVVGRRACVGPHVCDGVGMRGQIRCECTVERVADAPGDAFGARAPRDQGSQPT